MIVLNTLNARSQVQGNVLYAYMELEGWSLQALIAHRQALRPRGAGPPNTHAASQALSEARATLFRIRGDTDAAQITELVEAVETSLAEGFGYWVATTETP